MKNLYIFAGVNGAGKSTFYVNQLENDSFYGARINSDELVREFGDWRNLADQNRAAKLALKLRNSYLERGVDFNVETTLSGNGIVNFIKKAIKMGYELTLFYVGLSSVALSKQRVQIRVKKNGHSIDEAVLERRYEQSFKNLARILPLCKNAYIYDNSQEIDDEKEQKFSNLRLFAIKKDEQIRLTDEAKNSWLDKVLK
ncbi:zeta toxin family protein [Campylobacter gastrosuis]|uniref:Zeta toxin family protein n=1 Tax=Campylobacter gastrosuis TaxID=2974576 RepID=A0ABT7HRR7_9BACT|nr:AAA family ATPase [Campylobacter gastrosuis]MDL0089328.1 zeta toxin family protein [Campylobacter gastrosuis]